MMVDDILKCFTMIGIGKMRQRKCGVKRVIVFYVSLC